MTSAHVGPDQRTARRDAIKAIVCDVLEIPPDELTDTSLFREEHGADSMGAIEILSSLERDIGVTIDQNELARMVNLEGVYAVVDDATTA
ncbi:MAG TPA: acyl carrier protein [Pilimelia sp.]|nr:acyl carrier protein [Pilimelia sp.]